MIFLLSYCALCAVSTVILFLLIRFSPVAKEGEE